MLLENLLFRGHDLVVFLFNVGRYKGGEVLGFFGIDLLAGEFDPPVLVFDIPCNDKGQPASRTQSKETLGGMTT